MVESSKAPVSELPASGVQVSEVPLSESPVPFSRLSLNTSADKSPSSLTTYDLRTRTLTYMLKALNTQSNIPSLNYESLQPNPVVASSENLLNPALGFSSSKYHTTVDSAWLKVLNQVAQLLVREHEIVAVLPKRSGPTAHVSLMVTTDSDSESDFEGAASLTSSTLLETNYLIAQNPRNDQSSKTLDPTEALNALQRVSTMDSMLAYLNDHKHVSFSTHVSSVELLLNKIISESHMESSYLTRCKILRRYITFRAAPKMLRRFTAPAFQSFIQAVSTLTPEEVALAVSVNPPPGEVPLSTKLPFDHALVTDIIYFKPFDRSSCPHILAQCQRAGGIVNYTRKTAWEFHQLLIFCLTQANKVLSVLRNQLKSDPPQAVTNRALSNAEKWMGYLQNMIHYSPIFKAHTHALESTISAKMKPQAKADKIREHNVEPFNETDPGAQDETNGEADAGDMEGQGEEEYDADGGVSDTLLEITAAHAQDQATQQSLWLAVSYQQAIDVIVGTRTLPKTPISMTLWEPPAAELRRSAEMESWRSVVRDLYPSDGNVESNNLPSGGRPRERSTAPFSVPTGPITAQEVENVLSNFGRRKGGKARLFASSSEQRIQFRGAYHAESMLGTLAYLSRHKANPELQVPPAKELALFKHAYGTIGVSKRCCPVCTKILSLLSAHMTPPTSPTIAHDQHAPFKVLVAHQNIYPTALPPFTPIEVAQELVTWLECLLKASIDKRVYKERRSMRSGSASSQCSHGSGDSKGHSPPPRAHGDAQEEEFRGMGQAARNALGNQQFAIWEDDEEEEEGVAAQ
ncbi:hypothetical protein BGX38DRAFT_1273267 [Terfezia claveryi]|nr:hypothetical protein BGX38DRAFT_1273267 [Terfezia claveryi]